MEVTLDTCHFEMLPLNDVARMNMPDMDITFETAREEPARHGTTMLRKEKTKQSKQSNSNDNNKQDKTNKNNNKQSAKKQQISQTENRQ